MFIATLGTGQIYGKYGLHLMDESPENQDRIVAMVKQYIDIAEKLKSKITIGSIKGNVPKGADREKHLAIMGGLLRQISDYACAQNVTVLLEATNRFDNNVLNTGREIFEQVVEYWCIFRILECALHPPQDIPASRRSSHMSLKSRSL